MDKDIPHVLYHPVDIPGLSFWRLLWPAFVLGMRTEVTYSVLRNIAIDAEPYLMCDVLVLQRFGNKAQLEYVKKISILKKVKNFRIIYDIDDVMFLEDLPQHHLSRERDDFSQEECTKELMSICDEMVVSTPYLKEYYQKVIGHKKITVLPNRIPYFWAGHFYSPENVIRNYRKHKSRPRIIYAGSATHVDFGGEKEDDFSSVLKAIVDTSKEFKWVFIGVCPLQIKKYLEAGEMELHPWADLGDLPKATSRLEGNMMIAPLMDSPYNHAKSNIKLLEASAHGMPIACQDITPYKEAPIRFNSGEEMIQKIRDTLKSEDIYVKESLKGRKIIDKYWLELEENIGAYRDIFTYPYGDPKRGKGG